MGVYCMLSDSVDIIGIGYAFVSRIPVSAYSVDRLDCGFGSILYSD